MLVIRAARKDRTILNRSTNCVMLVVKKIVPTQTFLKWAKNRAFFDYMGWKKSFEIYIDQSGFRWPNHVTIACCLWEKKRFRANWHFWALYLGQRSHPCQSHVTGATYVSGQFGQVSLKSVKVWRRYGHVTQVSRLTRTVRRKRNTSHAPHNEQDPSKLCLSLQWM